MRPRMAHGVYQVSEHEWVRAIEAARMLGVSRERVRQLIAAGMLDARREPKRVCLVSVSSIQARLRKGAPE